MAARILEAIIARTRVLLPASTDLWLVSDNECTYQNDFIPVLAPFLEMSHGFRLRGFIYPKTVRGKSLVDAQSMHI